MTQWTDRFDRLLKAMTQGEAPSAKRPVEKVEKPKKPR
jgi:hypothetical protein